MARLPSIQTELVTTPIITSKVSGAEVAQASPFNIAAEAFGGIGAALSDIGDNYERATAAKYLATSSNDARTAALNLGFEANGNPETFGKAWEAFTIRTLSTAPAKMRDTVAANLEQVGGERYRAIMTERHGTDIANAKSTILDEIELLNGEASAIARTGGTGSKDYITRQLKITDLYGELSSNPSFGVSKADADLELRQKDSRHTAEGIIGSIGRTFRDRGMAAAEDEARRLLWDPKLALTPTERQQYIGQAVDQLRTGDAERKAQLKVAQDHATELGDMLKSDARLVDDSSVDRTISNLATLGDGAGAIALMKARAAARYLTTGSFGQASDAGQVDLYGRLFAPPSAKPNVELLSIPEQIARDQASLSSGTPAPGGAAAILRHEEGFRASAYWDVNAYRTGFGSDTVTLADGSIHKVTSTTVITPADAERDLNRRIGEFVASAAVDVGADRWNSLPPNVTAGLVSVAYNYGYLPKSVVAAVKTGDVMAIAVAVASLSANPERRQREAAIILGGAMPAYDPATDPAVVKSMRDEITADFDRHWTALQDGLKSSLPPSVDEMNLLADQLDIIDDPTKRKAVADFFASHADGYLLSQMSPAEGDAFLARLTSDVDGFSVAQIASIKFAREARAAQDAALKTDPIGFTIDQQITPPPPPLNLTDPGELIAGLAARQRIVDLAEPRFNLAGVSALRPSEASAVAAFWTKGNADQRIALLAALYQGLRPDTVLATLGGFADKSQTVGLAFAGGLALQNAEAARAVLRGEDALKVNPRFAFTAGADEDARNVTFPPSTLGPNMDAAYQAHLEAARAVYADASQTAGDTSQTFDEKRWTDAIQTVTGGVLDFNGKKIMAPQYGMTQQRFEDVMWALPDAAFAGAVTSGGQPVTKEFIRRRGQLYSGWRRAIHHRSGRHHERNCLRSTARWRGTHPHHVGARRARVPQPSRPAEGQRLHGQPRASHSRNRPAREGFGEGSTRPLQ